MSNLIIFETDKMVANLLKRENRVKLYLAGVGLELRAAFHRSGSHKLPGKMGELREDALAKFLTEWLPLRYRTKTNVLTVHKGNHELDRELDLVILDELDGFRLPLDADGGVTLAAWNDLKLHIEVKSIMGEEEFLKANSAAEACKKFGHDTNTNAPSSLLFAYDVEEKWFQDKFTCDVLMGNSDIFFEAIAILGRGIYFSPRFTQLAQQINRGLTKEMAESDCAVAEQNIMADVTFPTGNNEFLQVGTKSDADVLFGIMAFVAKSVATNATLSDELITAAQRPLYTPVLETQSKLDVIMTFASKNWNNQGTDTAFIAWMSCLKLFDRDSWNLLLCLHFGIYVYPANVLTESDTVFRESEQEFDLAADFGTQASAWLSATQFPVLKSEKEGFAQAVARLDLEKKALAQLNLLEFMSISKALETNELQRSQSEP